MNQIYLPGLKLNNTNASDTELSFFDLHLSISNGFVSSKIYDKHDDFDIAALKFLLQVNISRLIRFARVSSRVTDFKALNEILTAKRLQ